MNFKFLQDITLKMFGSKKPSTQQQPEEPVQNASARDFLEINMKLPDTKDDVKLIDKKGNLVKSPDYDPVA